MGFCGVKDCFASLHGEEPINGTWRPDQEICSSTRKPYVRRTHERNVWSCPHTTYHCSDEFTIVFLKSIDAVPTSDADPAEVQAAHAAPHQLTIPRTELLLSPSRWLISHHLIV